MKFEEYLNEGWLLQKPSVDLRKDYDEMFITKDKSGTFYRKG